jgi:ADP-ribose pyrophosphatase YjhB (NUDIX family)
VPEPGTAPARPSHAFCSLCGAPLQEKLVEAEGRERLICVGCGHIHYQNPTVVAGVIPIARGKIWLLRRAIEPRYGAWTYPAGFVELGESVEDAAARETREELNLEIRLVELLGVYSRPPMTSVVIVYVANAISEPSIGEETLEFAAFAPDEIPWQDLAFWSTEAALRDWVKRIAS